MSDLPVSNGAYLKYGFARDAKNPSDRRLYRRLEILPGALLWLTLGGVILAATFLPIGASFFVIAFDAYWLLKTVFFSVHLRAGHKKMRENLKIDWQRKLEQMANGEWRMANGTSIQSWRDIYHLVILPFYKEPYEVVRESLSAIVSAPYPKDRFVVVLGVEERAGKEALEVAGRLQREFENKFFKFLVAVHPSGIPGELAGKGSNETYAIRQVKEKIIDPFKIPYERILVSSLDIDTQIYPHYFGVLTYNYLTAADPLHSSYQPIPIYNNNIWDVPFFSRVVATSGTFWQMMQQARPERLSSFSSHSLPFKTLAEMDYWHVNIVSEDSRIFWQALLNYDGHWQTVPLFYPVSMDANVGPTLRQTVKNVYIQQRRWGWGVENVPYTIFGFIKNKKIKFSRKLYWTFVQLEGFWSWATNALIIFFLGWLPILLGGTSFNVSVLSYNLPRITRLLMTFAMLGLITSAIISTSLLPPRPAHKKKRTMLWMVLQWIFLPFTIIFFGSLPAIDSQTRLLLGKYMGYWVTPKFRGKSDKKAAS